MSSTDSEACDCLGSFWLGLSEPLCAHVNGRTFQDAGRVHDQVLLQLICTSAPPFCITLTRSLPNNEESSHENPGCDCSVNDDLDHCNSGFPKSPPSRSSSRCRTGFQAHPRAYPDRWPTES